MVDTNAPDNQIEGCSLAGKMAQLEKASVHIGSQHPAFLDLRRLSQNRQPADDQRLLIDGLWIIPRLQQLPLEISALYICPELLVYEPTIDWLLQAVRRSANCYILSRRLFERVSSRDDPDGLLMILPLPVWQLDHLALGPDAIITVLDGLETPGNVGTILRTCDGAGVDAVFLAEARARLTHPGTVKSSMGTLLSVPIFQFTDPVLCRDWLRAHGFTLYLADADAAETYQSVRYAGRSALIMGSERFGINPCWYEGGHVPLAIPMNGISDSLNVGVAASIFIYEATMQRCGRKVKPD
ncbi:MAG: TrmH family RNA methyltransferase [Eubacteriales bacterium]|nr:TrmH family RNA methyltransferase [Eubacteriales bacterium]MDD4462502.1 TrmH family RNA methyltransferase [Eubacteriales bacterium]